jgi:hypothetical protein
MLWWWTIAPALGYLIVGTGPGSSWPVLGWVVLFGLLALVGGRLTVVPHWIKDSGWKLWRIERGVVKRLPEDVRYTFREVIAVHQDMHLHARVSVTPILPRRSVWIRLRFEEAPSEKTVQLLLRMREELLKSSTLSLEMMHGSVSLPSYSEPYNALP